jgi:hypothetical protein
MLTSGPPVRSGPSGSPWNVMAWASHTKPAPTNCSTADDPHETAAATANRDLDLGSSQLYTFNVPKSCSMELCTLGGYGSSLQQRNPALELPLVRRLLSAAVEFSTVLYPEPDSAERAKLAQWKDILGHLAPLPLTTTVAPTRDTTRGTTAAAVAAAGRTEWVWAETNIPSSAVFGANSWYPLDYYSPMHPGNGVGIRTRASDPEAFGLARRTVAALNAATVWSPESGAQMDWIAAVRLGWNATEVILRSGAALGPGSRYPMFPSFYGTDGGSQTHCAPPLRFMSHNARVSLSRRCFFSCTARALHERRCCWIGVVVLQAVGWRHAG